MDCDFSTWGGGSTTYACACLAAFCNHLTAPNDDWAIVIEILTTVTRARSNTRSTFLEAISAYGMHQAAIYFDGSTVAATVIILSSTYARCTCASCSRDGAAIDDGMGAAAAFTATDACAIIATPGINYAIPNSDGGRRTVFTSADACRLVTSKG